jgi:hypothetical protein
MSIEEEETFDVRCLMWIRNGNCRRLMFDVDGNVDGNGDVDVDGDGNADAVMKSHVNAES